MDAGAQDAARDAPRLRDSGFDAFLPRDGGHDAWIEPTDVGRDVPWIDAPRIVDAARDPCAPRPISPLSTATTTTRQPTFRWEPGSGGATRLEICADRACGTVLDAVAVTDARATSSFELPPGVVFWRLVATDAACAGAAGPTWQATIPWRSAPMDASSGTTLDVNGDGFADVAISASTVQDRAGRVVVYLGSASGLDTSPAITLAGHDLPNEGFGASVGSAGDVDGDGFGDLVVGAINQSGDDGVRSSVFVFLGSSLGLDAHDVIVLDNPRSENTWFGQAVASAGDVDGDGYGDVVVGDGIYTMTPGFGGLAYVFRGGPAGTERTPSTTLDTLGGSWSGFGSDVTGLDLDSDGFGDVVVGADLENGQSGAAYVFLGSAAGLTTSPLVRLAPIGGGGLFGSAISRAGDVNGDGYADFVIGSFAEVGGTGRAYVFSGSSSGVLDTPRIIDSPLSGSAYFGFGVGGGGDVDGDGNADVVISAPQDSDSAGSAFLVRGGPAGDTTRFGAGDTRTGFGEALAVVGDVDGDGRGDVVVGAPFGATASAYLYLGTTTGLASTRTGLPGPFASDFFAGGFFGGAIATGVVRSVDRDHGLDARGEEGSRASAGRTTARRRRRASRAT